MVGQRALVTGGAGFIGSHLVDRLVQEGFQVAVVDNLSTGRQTNLRQGVQFHCVDLCDLALADVFRKERPQIVFHVAAQASVIHSLKHPADDARANVLGSLNLLQQCRDFRVERFIYSSTGGALYGYPKELPCGETHPVRPLSPYGVSKYAVEGYLHCYGPLAGFRYTILRYGNVYGPRQDPYGEAGVVAIFARRMLDAGRVVIYGDGRQERDFVYVGDVVEANMLALEQQADEVYNISTGSCTSVNTIFGHLARMTGYQQAPVHEPPRSGEVWKICLDVGKASRKLRWSPRVDLEEGLCLAVKHFGESP